MSWKRIPVTSFELKLDLTLACGQSFRWQEITPGVWSSVLAGSVWYLSQTPEELLYRVWHPAQPSDCDIKGNTKSDGPAGESIKEETYRYIKHENHTDVESSSKNCNIVNRCKEMVQIKKEDCCGSTQTLSCDLQPDGSPCNGSSHDNRSEMILRDYFQLDVSLQELYAQWCKADPVFRKIASTFSGIRILRQDPVENLFSFICSSNNHISRISAMVEKLCQHFGPKLLEVEVRNYYGFPSVEALAADGVEEQLRGLGFGYRAKYISASAKYIARERSTAWLMGLRDCSYPQAKSQLMALTGVGAKVADCVCLMSLDKHQAIPVDTHVWQFTARDYMPHLRQCKSVTVSVYNSIGEFFHNLWGDYAGWAHSVLFSADLKKFQDRKHQTENQAASNVKKPKISATSRVKKAKLTLSDRASSSNDPQAAVKSSIRPTARSTKRNGKH